MKEYAIILDTGSSYNLNSHDNIYIVPILINVKEGGELKTFEDTITIKRDQINYYIDNGFDIFTSQPNFIKVEELIKDLSTKYKNLIFVPLSKHLSGFFNNLKKLEEQFKNFVVVDSETIGIDGNWIIEEIHNLFASNKIKEIQEINTYFVNRKKSICGAVILRDFDQLIKGGRISKTKAFFAKACKFKIAVKFQGDLQFFSKDFSIEASISKVLKMIDDQISYSKYGIKRISIMNDLKDQELGESLRKSIYKKLNITNDDPSLLPGCIITHVGTNTFSILIEANKK